MYLDFAERGCSQVRRPLPLAVPLSVLLDAQVLGVEMPQERLIRSILADFEGWQVCVSMCMYGCERG